MKDFIRNHKALVTWTLRVLTVLLAVMKVTKVINLPWWKVSAPVWAPLVVKKIMEAMEIAKQGLSEVENDEAIFDI